MKPSEFILIHTNDPRVETMGGGVAYMNFLLREALKNRIPTRYIGVDLLGTSDKNLINDDLSQEINLTLEPILKNQDNWARFFISLLFKAFFTKTDKFTVIHVQRLIYLFPFCLFKKKGVFVLTSDMPLITAVEKYGFFFRLLYPIFLTIEKITLKRINAIISDSRILDSYYNERYPQYRDKYYYDIDPAVGLDLNNFKTIDSSTSKNLLFVGRIDEVKRVPFLIEAFSELDYKKNNYNFYIVGDDGGDIDNVLNKISDLGIEKYVHLVGPKFSEDLRSIYENSRLLLLGSRSEGNPTVVREAIASGTPVVSTDVGDVSKILTNHLIREIVTLDSSPKEYAKSIEIQLSKTVPIEDFISLTNKFSSQSIFEKLIVFYLNLRKENE